MEHRYRKIIDDNCEYCADNINMRNLWPKMLKNKIFNFDDVNVPIWKKNLDSVETIRDILLTTKTRGPFAFRNLILSLRQSDHAELAARLQDCVISSYNNNHHVHPFMEPVNDDYHTNILETYENLEIKVRKATGFLDIPDFTTIGNYRMRSRPRGYVLIIILIDYWRDPKRPSAEADERNLVKLFQDMGFEVTAKRDLTGSQIKETVKEFSQKDFRTVDSCFVIISSHGHYSTEHGYPATEIHGVDDKNVLCTDIINYFTGKSKPYLEGKPKIFVFQCCREHKPTEEDKSKNKDEPRTETDGLDKTRTLEPRPHSDILVAHSTMPSNVSYRDKHTGSWYIQIFCEVLMNYACSLHLVDLFSLIDKRLKNLRTADLESQTSTTKLIGFNKHCYLNPGLFDESSD